MKIVTKQFNSREEALAFRDSFSNDRGMPDGSKKVAKTCISFPNYPSTIHEVQITFK